MEKQIRDTIQDDYDENGDAIVMQNRVSWEAFDKIRKTEGLVPTPTQKLEIYQHHLQNAGSMD